MTESQNSNLKRTLIIITLIAAGETVFLLPFVVARIFRPTFLDVFELTNLQLGSAFSVYGIVAMIAYLAGGPLADRFTARRLMASALIITSLGGFIFADIPSLAVLTLLYGFWGLTTVLLFWAALIKATREWGGTNSQGRAYGLLDGGRGLLAALLASISVVVFASFLPEDVASASLEEKRQALSRLILIYTGLIIAVGALVWIAVPEPRVIKDTDIPESLLKFAGVKKVLKMPTVLLQAIIVVCAYVGYKTTDDFSLYVSDAFGYDDVAAAQIGTISFWVRPFAALAAGLIADKFRSSNIVIVCFAILLVGSASIAMGALTPGIHWIIISTLAATSVGIYALRGIYFALFEEAKVPIIYTGSAVGIVSVIGYTPDIFMGPLMGYLIDRSPGAVGHHHVFAVLAAFALIGLLATFAFQRVNRKQNQHNNS